MMKNIKIQIISLSLFILSMISLGCRENIDNIQLDSTRPRLVIEGYVSTDTTRQMVKLSLLGDALNKEPIKVVSNALITISDGTTTYQLTEDQTKKGTYYTAPDVYGIPGRTYSLLIKNVDINNDQVMEEYTAQSLLKRLNPIDSIHLVYNNLERDRRGWSINLYTLDPGQGRNFYLIKVLKNNHLLTDSIFKYSIFDNNSFEGKYFDGFPVYNLREDRKEEKLIAGDTVTVELFGITEDYYSFIYSYITDYYPKVPIFSGPSANIPTNIQPIDDAVGVFAAYSIKR
ncbi:MAG TPA: DUF4249 family protein, partial [Prolixibacteraceae bacterium]